MKRDDQEYYYEDPQGDAEAGEYKPRIPLLPFDHIEIDTEPEYLIEGLLPAEGLGVVYGAPKTIKSFWTSDMGMHIALGWEYRGRAVQQGAVVYCAFEGGRGFMKRIVAFKRHHRSRLKDHQSVPFYLQPLRLDLIEDVDDLALAIKEQMAGTNPTLIVLDTLNRSLRGSENKDEDMSAYIRAADILRQQYKCLVVIVHHCGVEAGRPRGHTSLTGAVDVLLAVKRVSKSLVTTLTVEFMKDGEEGAALTSRLEIREVGMDRKGTPITSGVLVPTEAQAVPEPKAKGRKLPAAARIAERALREAIDKVGAIPPENNYTANVKAVTDDQWRTYAYQMSISTGEDRAKQVAFARAAQRLVAEGIVGTWGGWYWPSKE